MTYTPTVPQANQTVSATQPLIQANFAFLDAAVAVDHNFDVSNSALTHHQKVSLPNSAIAETAHLTPATGTDGVLYAQVSGPDTTPTSGLRYYSTTGNQIFRLTDSSVGASGFHWHGAILEQWGIFPTPFGGPTTVTFPTAFPNNAYNVQITAASTSSSFKVSVYVNGTPTLTTFTFASYGTTAGTTSIYWRAIGN
jgi:hypothetical protein